MKTKYIDFVDISERGKKTKTWKIETKRTKDVIGSVSWYAPWRQYCFFPQPGTVYSAQCLEDIMRFLLEQTMEHRHRRPGPC